MQRKLYLTKLRPERRDEYIQAHRNVSGDLMRRYREAGISLCAVYILGDQVALLVEAEDHAGAAAILARDPMDLEWQSYVAPMKADGGWQEMQELFHSDRC